MKPYLIYLFFFLPILVTLVSNNFSSSSNNTNKTSPNPTIETVSATDNIIKIDASQVISSEGIGEVRLGMTYGELKKSLLSEDSKTTFNVKSPFMVDFDANAINRNGETLYYILYPATSNFSDSSVIELVLTENPNYRTDKGIGVGTKIKDAEVAYGKATLGYNTSNEPREGVSFTNQPANIYFRPSKSPDNFAGIYKSPLQEYNETNQFKEDAVIESVMVRK